MAQRGADNLEEWDDDDRDDHEVIELDEGDLEFDFTAPDGPLVESMLAVVPPNRGSEVRKKINTTNYVHINPSKDGWTIRLDMGEKVDQEFRSDVSTLDQWRRMGVFNIRFEKFGKRLIAVIKNSEFYEADRFGKEHLAVFGKRRYQVVTTAPPQCLRLAQSGVRADTIRMEIYEKARRQMNEEIPQKIPNIEYYRFEKLVIYMSEKKLREKGNKIHAIAGIEGLNMQVIDQGTYIRKIILTKNSHHPSQMLEHSHAVFLATFNPDIS